MHGKCTRCNKYGLIENHHPLPRRWFGGRKRDGRRNSWTEPLCPKCHFQADLITKDIDADFGITNHCEGVKMKDVFIDAFVMFMNKQGV